MTDFEIISVVIMVISHGAASQIFDLSRQRFSQSENSETSGFRPFVLRRLNELYAGKGQVGFMASKRLDGRTVLPEAIQLLQMKTA